MTKLCRLATCIFMPVALVAIHLACGGGGGGSAATPAAPAITTQPSNQTVTMGATATFTVACTGTPTPTYQWNQGSAAITGATGASYTTPATTMAMSGNTYTCTVTNSAGTATSNPATLTVTAPVAPVFTTQPSSATVTAGATATFTVACSGTPAPTFQWNEGGTAIAGATGSTYTTPATTLAMSGNTYTCTATNAGGNVTSNPATLTVNPSPLSAPVITVQPQAAQVTAPATATFTVTATGNPTPTYQWNLAGVAIAGATSASYTTPATTTAMSGNSYTVTLTNSQGHVTSTPAVLTVNPAGNSADPEGIYTGTMASTTYGNLTAIAGALSTGEVHLATSTSTNPAAGGYPFEASLTLGNGGGTGTLFAGAGTVTEALTATNVTVVAGTSVAGSYSTSGDTGTFSLTYDSLYTRPKALASLAGNYATGNTVSSKIPLTMSLDSQGNISGSSSYGSFTGTLTVIDPTKNVFRMTLQMQTGAYSGLAFWSDTAANGLSANALYFSVANGSTIGLAGTFVPVS